MYNIGITGTRDGMTQDQKDTFSSILEYLITNNSTITNFHHGQCVGVDVEAAIICEDDFDLKIISHPPIKTDLIGFCVNHEIRPAYGYFQRNRNIVNESDLMFVIPKTEDVQSKGGTWYTYAYSLKNAKPTILIKPSGEVELFNITLGEK